jgi:phage tail-like protein
MALMRERPYTGANFLVDFGDGNARSVTAGFAEVIFPPFDVDDAELVAGTSTTPGKHLVLRRGVIGSLDLYAWWAKARRSKAPSRRTVTIELLSEDQATVALTWRFHGVRPVRLAYSPLSAAEGGVLTETLELAFDSVEMS